jgi:hypothetical protein
LERVAATSWPASLAAKAAEAQGPVVADRVLRRLREYTFLLGTPPDTVERALAAVNGVPELDFDRLAADLVTESVHTAVRQDWTETRAPCREVLRIDDPGPHNGRAKPTERGHRYALPTVVVTGPGGRAVIPGWRGPGEYVRAVRQVAPDCVVEPGPLDPVEALRRYRSLTSRDLVLLTGTDRVPGGAVPVHTAGGPLWLHPDEAAVHPATR